MSSVNKVILVGRAGADPELKNISNDGKVVNFSLATSESFKGKDGNKTEKTEWHNIVAWGQLAETISKYVTKGSQVYLEGKIQTRTWDDKDGNKKYTTEVVANSVVFLGSKKAGENGGEATTNTNKNTTQNAKASTPATVTTGNDSDNDDLPF